MGRLGDRCDKTERDGTLKPEKVLLGETLNESAPYEGGGVVILLKARKRLGRTELFTGSEKTARH